MSQRASSLPGPYIPTFYQLDKDLHICCSETFKVRMFLFNQKPSNFKYKMLAIPESLPNFNFYIQNTLMQQHLAHLYFIAVLERLQTKAPKPNFLIRLASKIDEVGIIENSSYLQLHFEQDVMYSTAMQ